MNFARHHSSGWGWRFISFSLALPISMLFFGCMGPVAPAKKASQAAETFIAAPQDGATPTEEAAHWLTRIAVVLIAVGLLFAAVTRLSTGFGVSIAAAGLGMLLLAWTVEQWWVPWLSLLSVIGYGVYWVMGKVNNAN